MPDQRPVATALARHAVQLRQQPVPEAALAAARRAFVDWAGITIGGSVEPPATILTNALVSAQGTSRLVGRPTAADPSVAALVNGTAAHTLELDDIYAPGLFHPGAPVIAAALAVADREHATGLQLLRAILLGYEVGNRVAADLGPAHYTYWHTTGTVGSVAAAAAAAELLGADEEGFAHALSLAVTMAAGLQQTFRRDAMGKPLHAGHAAQSGVVAALAAGGGLTGAPDAFEGDVGMGAAMGDRPHWHRAREPFGPDFLVQYTTVKPYPCCGHTFAAIDAALSLRSSGVHVADIASIEVHTYRTALAVAGNPAPATVPEARFSLPFTVACALREGSVTMNAFTEQILVEPEITGLMQKVELHVGAEFEEAFPARRGARVVVVDGDGKRSVSVAPDRRGSPENPLTDDQVEAKFIGVASRAMGEQRAAQALECMKRLPRMHDVLELMLA